MEKCKYCKTKDAIKYSKYSNGKFCSKECARGYSTKEKRKEINEKISKYFKGYKFPSRHFSDEKWNEINEKRKKNWDDKILSSNYSDLSFERLKKRIVIEQKGKCNRCKLDKWLGVDITLELEHIDGNHNNNDRVNLEALCPNCHSLTPTWRGRNKTTNINKIKDDVLLKALVENNFNMRQALIFVGLAPKGGNYVRCHRLKREYNDIL